MMRSGKVVTPASAPFTAKPWIVTTCTWNRVFNRKAGTTMRTVNVSGMTCSHCVMRVTNALKEIEGVREVKVDLEHGTVVFEESIPVDMKTIVARLEEAGYGVVE